MDRTRPHRAGARSPSIPVPGWAPILLALGAVAQVGLGLAMSIWPTAEPFASVSGERLAWQAVGVLQLVLGAALFLAVSRPARNSGLIAVGIVAKLGGLGFLIYTVLAHGAYLPAVMTLGGFEVFVALLLGLPLRALLNVPEVAPQPSEIQPVAATTLFGLQQTLQSLAAPASIQLTMFPDLVSNGERVMADFKLWRDRALRKREAMSPQQEEILRGLDECLHRMLDEGAAGLWTVDAVRSSVEWGQLRAAARRALVAFSWSVDMPIAVLRQPREQHPSIDLRHGAGEA